ncbi:N-acylneuraminate cytidylyltransferase [subsurface metagenome]
MKPRIIAIIPARGGSKGIPRKNVRLLCGKPLIAYAIEAALDSKYIDRVLVSTEDEEIAEIAREYGSEVIERPSELADDFSTTEPVLEHAVRYMEETEGYQPNVIVLLQPTSPLRNHQHIDEALEAFFTNKYDSLLSVCSSYAFLWKVDDKRLHPLNYDFQNRPRRQDREPEYRENGAIYITKHDILMHRHNRLGGKIGLYIMPVEASWEIDTEFDLWLCEQLIISQRSA